jgi:hypothetical protein
MLTDDWSDRKILAEAVIQIYNCDNCVIYVLQQQQQHLHQHHTNDYKNNLNVE